MFVGFTFDFGAASGRPAQHRGHPCVQPPLGLVGGVPTSSLSAGPWSCDPDRPLAPTCTPAQCHTRRARRVPPVPGRVAPGFPPDVPPSCSLAPRSLTAPPPCRTDQSRGSHGTMSRLGTPTGLHTLVVASPAGGQLGPAGTGVPLDANAAAAATRSVLIGSPLKPFGDSALKSSPAPMHTHPHMLTHRMGAHVFTHTGKTGYVCAHRMGAHVFTHTGKAGYVRVHTHTQDMHTLQRPAPDGTAAGVESGAWVFLHQEGTVALVPTVFSSLAVHRRPVRVYLSCPLHLNFPEHVCSSPADAARSSHPKENARAQSRGSRPQMLKYVASVVSFPGCSWGSAARTQTSFPTPQMKSAVREPADQLTPHERRAAAPCL